MNKGKTASFVLSFVLLFSFPAEKLFSSVMDYYSYDYHSDYATWQDANKFQTGGCLSMCWAAAAANVLAWNNWGTGQFSTAQEIFQEYIDHWTDEGGSPFYAWQWWLNGVLPPSDPSWSQVDVPGSGGFWPNYNFLDYFRFTNNISNIDADVFSYLHFGYGVTLTLEAIIDGTSYAHAVTLWGYQFDLDLGQFTKIYITDSDDQAIQLIDYPLIWDESETRWELGGTYTDWYITEALALGHRVPEPGLPALLLIGLTAIAIVRRRGVKPGIQY